MSDLTFEAVQGQSASAPVQPAPEVATARATGPNADPSEIDNTHAVIWTTVIIAVIVALAHGLLGLNYWLGTNDDPGDDLGLAWQPIVAVALSMTSIVTFGGFYVASRRARIAIGSAFILTFLVMLPFVLTIPAMEKSADTAFATSLVDQFSTTVGLVVAFYFATEGAIAGMKIFQVARNPQDAEIIKRADRDLATHQSSPTGEPRPTSGIARREQ